jgi:PhnB protein
MAIRLNPYLHFEGTAREAMNFYCSILGGDLVFSTFGEAGMAEDPADQDKIMHSMLTTPDDLVLMAGDAPTQMETAGHSGYSVTINGYEDESERLADYFERLSEGGSITCPYGPAPWGATFGVCVDKFGVDWLVNCQKAEA